MNRGLTTTSPATAATMSNAWLKGVRGDWKSRIVIMLPVRWRAPDQPMVEDGCGISSKGDEHKLGACCQRQQRGHSILAGAGCNRPARHRMCRKLGRARRVGKGRITHRSLPASHFAFQPNSSIRATGWSWIRRSNYDGGLSLGAAGLNCPIIRRDGSGSALPSADRLEVH